MGKAAVVFLVGTCCSSWLAPAAGLTATPPGQKAGQPPPATHFEPGDVLVTEATSPYAHIQIVLHPRALPSLHIHARNCVPEERNRDLSADRILTDPRPAGSGPARNPR